MKIIKLLFLYKFSNISLFESNVTSYIKYLLLHYFKKKIIYYYIIIKQMHTIHIYIYIYETQIVLIAWFSITDMYKNLWKPKPSSTT